MMVLQRPSGRAAWLAVQGLCLQSNLLNVAAPVPPTLLQGGCGMREAALAVMEGEADDLLDIGHNLAVAYPANQLDW